MAGLPMMNDGLDSKEMFVAGHGPACIAFHCSHLYITKHGSVSHFAKTWVLLQTTTYISKSTKYFDIFLLLTCEEVLLAPTVQI